MGKIWLPDEVEARLWEAAITLRRLPLGRNDIPAPLRCVWPAPVQGWWNAFARQRETGEPARPRQPRVQASAEQITRLDEVRVWLFWVDRETCVLLWARATGVTWRRLEDADGRSRVTLAKIHREGLLTIAAKLSGASAPVRPARLARGGLTPLRNDSIVRS